jgi:hypothetical protein
MNKSLNVQHGQGLSAQSFFEAMTKNQEKYKAYYDQFQWGNEEDRTFFESLNNRDDLCCYILAADWCGDVIRNVPAVLRALEISGIPTKILIQEQHMDLMDQFLTLGGRAIPIVIFTDTGGFVLGHWGPRPKYVQEPMVKFKQENTDKEATDYEEKLQATRREIVARYGEDTQYQQWIITELRDLISTF